MCVAGIWGTQFETNFVDMKFRVDCGNEQRNIFITEAGKNFIEI